MSEYKWTVLKSDCLTEEQKLWFLPPKYSHFNSIVMVSIDIDDKNCDWIIIGENTPENNHQADIICKAFNDNKVPANPVKERSE